MIWLPVNGYGLSTHGHRKATGRVKPKQYGSLSYVQSCVARNAESIGIDPASIVGYWPFWEGAGGTAWDVSLYGLNAVFGSNTVDWANDSVYFNSNNTDTNGQTAGPN